ncbi:hypothetical protein [Leeuwenhoekiella sp. W20_SRS_FM14]|uniref:hypothetical protein n=1 Tax=Leeuwenhoekiella sp. W20_SRS_FM14 TaxID=3240270 RepID=UPI003F94BD07
MNLKALYFLVLLPLAITSCDTASSDDENPETQNPALRVQITTNTATPFIDYILEAEITTSNSIKEVEVTDDGGASYTARETSEPEGQGTQVKLYFSYATLGTRKLEFKVTDIYGQVVPFSETITVTRGNAVRILSAEVISFYKKDQTWDPEFADTDVNRLADVGIGLLKSKLNDRFGGTDYTMYRWYISESRQNQSNLFFDLTEENLYIDLNKEIRIGLADDDGGNIAQSLIPDFPDYRIVDLKTYATTRPKVITLKDDSIDLEIKFTVEWPQG